MYGSNVWYTKLMHEYAEVLSAAYVYEYMHIYYYRCKEKCNENTEICLNSTCVNPSQLNCSNANLTWCGDKIGCVNSTINNTHCGRYADILYIALLLRDLIY